MASTSKKAGVSRFRFPLKYAQRLHAQARIYHRYGIRLPDDEYYDACSALGDPAQRRLLWTQPDRREIHAVRVRDRWIVVVYDPKTKRIVTFLPPKALREFGFQPPVA